jgi:hypothetical protein
VDIKDFIGFAITFASMAYGFGRLANETKNNRIDINKIGDLHRDTIKELSEINKKLERLDQRVIYCEK